MKTVKMTVTYDGTDYCGFQRQRPRRGVEQITVDPEKGVLVPLPGKVSIQEVLEAALTHVVGNDIMIVGAGRTDAGVHARGQVISFKADLPFRVDRLPYALNRVLPPDVVISAAEGVMDGFHARFSARSKIYKYTIWTEKFPSPFLRRYTWHLPKTLDVESMKEAARFMLGEQDFAAFQASGTPVKSTVRNVFRCELDAQNNQIAFVVEADGFLYKMVRTMVGTLVAIGRGRWKPEKCREIILSRDRRQAGPAAPPQGLFLEKVIY